MFVWELRKKLEYVLEVLTKKNKGSVFVLTELKILRIIVMEVEI